jgi:hypothetical protein
MAVYGKERGGTITCQANRIDTVTLQDLDRVRFYPVIRDGLRTRLVPIVRAEFHFQSADSNIAEAAQDVVGPRIRQLVRSLVKGGMEFGWQACEIVWRPIFNVSVTCGQADIGGKARNYPFLWAPGRIKSFSPKDTRILINPNTGMFAGVRQMNGAEHRDVPAVKCVHYAHDMEFDMNYGVAATKATIPFVEGVESVFDSMIRAADIYANPYKLARYPEGKITQADGVSIDFADRAMEILDSLEGGSSIAIPSTVYANPGQGMGSGEKKWDVSFEGVGGTAYDYVGQIQCLNDMVRMALAGVPEMAGSSSPDTGTYNLGKAQIDLFLTNTQSYLDEVELVINEQLMPQWTAYNFGSSAPACYLRFEPVDSRVAAMVLETLMGTIASGAPMQDGEGNLIEVDMPAIARDKGLPLIMRKRDPATDKMLDDIRKGLAKPPTDIAGKDDEDKPKLSARTWLTESMDPSRIEVHPDMQYKAGADGEGGTREWIENAAPYDPSKASPLLVWEDLGGRRYVVDGHHRRQIAMDQGVASVPVNVIREADGVTFDQAKGAGIASNIRKGTLSDWNPSKHPRGDGGRFSTKDHPEFDESHVVNGVLPSGYGEVGPIFAQFSGDGHQAIDHLLKVQAGEVPGALDHPEIGGIDLVFGGPKFGLMKIRDRHPEVLAQLPEIIASLPVVAHRSVGDSYLLDNGRYSAVVKKNWGPNRSAKRWLLTAFEVSN